MNAIGGASQCNALHDRSAVRGIGHGPFHQRPPRLDSAVAADRCKLRHGGRLRGPRLREGVRTARRAYACDGRIDLRRIRASYSVYSSAVSAKPDTPRTSRSLASCSAVEHGRRRSRDRPCAFRTDRETSSEYRPWELRLESPPRGHSALARALRVPHANASIPSTSFAA